MREHLVSSCLVTWLGERIGDTGEKYLALEVLSKGVLDVLASVA